jgi:Uma2 family endonuclease
MQTRSKRPSPRVIIPIGSDDAEPAMADDDGAFFPPLRAFTVEEYLAMGRAGILDEDDRSELIEGAIVEMTPINPPHSGTVIKVSHRLGRALGDKALVSTQNPVRLGDRSLPQPDFALLRPVPDFYQTVHPAPADVLLMIEVADTTVRYDRSIKAPLYARAGIVEYWLFVLPRREIEVYRNPGPEGYGTMFIVRPGERLSLAALPDVEFAVANLL